MIATVGALEELNMQPETEAEAIMQNVRMLLSLRRGSVAIEREMGLSAEYIDAPIGVTRARLAADLTEQLERYEPRASLVRLDFGGSDGRLEVVATIKL